MEGVTNGLTGAVSTILDIFTKSIVPIMTTEPMVYFLAAGLIVTVIGIFATARHSA